MKRKKILTIIIIVLVLIVLTAITITLILKYNRTGENIEESENVTTTQETTGIIETNSNYIIIDGEKYDVSYVSDGNYRLRKY